MPGLPENSESVVARALSGPGLELERLDGPDPLFHVRIAARRQPAGHPRAGGAPRWTVTEGIAESLTAGECNGVNPEFARISAVGGLCAAPSDLARMHQDVDVSAEADSIDAGSVLARAAAWMSDWSGSDIPAMWLRFSTRGRHGDQRDGVV